jgi:hypothetical protein
MPVCCNCLIKHIFRENCIYTYFRSEYLYARSQNCEKGLLASSCVCVCVCVCVYVCLYARLHGTTRLPLADFHKNWSKIRKYIEKPQGSVKYDKNSGRFIWRPIHIFYHTSLISSQNEKCFRQICGENRNTQFIFNTFFFLINVPFVR